MASYDGARQTGNLFLDALPDGVAQSLLPKLSRVVLKEGEIVYDRGAEVDYVLFPIHSLVSVVMELSKRDIAEVGIVGREGMTGLPIALGGGRAYQRCVVQVPDGAHRLDGAAFREALEQSADLKSLTLRYAEAVLTTTAQLSACNTVHSVNERCARWLLMAHDRVEGDTFLLTQEFLGQMLGVRRGSVNVAASTLQEAGFITYSRGHIVVRNRAGLESAACDCYKMLDRDWHEIMGYSAGKARGTGIPGAHVTRLEDSSCVLF